MYIVSDVPFSVAIESLVDRHCPETGAATREGPIADTATNRWEYPNLTLCGMRRASRESDVIGNSHAFGVTGPYDPRLPFGHGDSRTGDHFGASVRRLRLDLHDRLLEVCLLATCGICLADEVRKVVRLLGDERCRWAIGLTHAVAGAIVILERNRAGDARRACQRRGRRGGRRGRRAGRGYERCPRRRGRRGGGCVGRRIRRRAEDRGRLVRGFRRERRYFGYARERGRRCLRVCNDDGCLRFRAESRWIRDLSAHP